MTTLAALLLALPTPQETDVSPQTMRHDETVVTARKFEEPLFDLPGSATVLQSEELEAGGLMTVSDAGRRVPDLYFSEFTARRLSFPFVRGVGSGSGDPSVITYIDDVPQLGFGGTNLPLFEVERIEFLRGPQGTLYGRNAMGGVIHVRSARPTSVRELGAALSVASYDEIGVSGSYSGPVGSDILGHFGLMNSERDGYTKNDFSGNRVDDRDGLFGRTTLLFEPNSTSELQVSFFGERSRDGGFALSFLEDSPLGVNGLRDNPHHVNQDFEGLAHRDVLSPSVVYRGQPSEEYDFTSISAFQRWDILEKTDFDFSPIDAVRRRTEENQSYFYQELRIGTAQGTTWPLSPWREVSWLLGLSGFASESERESANNFRPGIVLLNPLAPVGIDTSSGDFEEQGLSLFGQATVTIDERLELTGGLRADVEWKEVDRLRTFQQGGFVVTTDQGGDEDTTEELDPLLSLAYHLDQDTLAYGRAARGHRAGGFNVAAPTPGQIEFDPESCWTYELGFRRAFAEQRAQVGAGVFLNDLEDMQLSLFDPVAGGFVDNAGEAESRGLELEGQAELVDELQAFASLGWMSSEFDEFTDSFGQDNSGKELPFAPETTWSLGLQYGGELASETGWFVRGEYNDVGEFFYDAGNLGSEDYALVNLRAGIEGRRFGLTLWVRNAFDEEYVPVAFQPDPGNASTFVGESGAPRVLGFTLSVRI